MVTTDFSGPGRTLDNDGGSTELRRRLIARLRTRASGGVIRGRLTEVEPLSFRYADMEVSAFIRDHYDGPMVRLNGTKLLVLTAVITGVTYEAERVKRILREAAAYPLTSVCVTQLQSLDGRVGLLEVYSTHLAEQVTDEQLDLALRSMTQHYHHMPLAIGAFDLDELHAEKAQLRRRKEARHRRAAKNTKTTVPRTSELAVKKIQHESHGRACNAIDDDLITAALAELDKLVGLQEVKAQIRQLVAVAKFRAARQAQGAKLPPMAPHLVFVGNPGTCKTTVAGLIGRIYQALGLLKKGHVKVVGRGDLVAEFSGQTAPRTTKACREALDGILFIDEAYSLSEHRDSFGLEAIQTLLVEMEQHRGELAVVVAGYPEPMKDFLESNPGLKSRFDKTISFGDYSNDELVEIFISMASEQGLHLDHTARKELSSRVSQVTRARGFGNGREVRRWLDVAIEVRASRWMEGGTDSAENLNLLDAASIRAAFEQRVNGPKPSIRRVGYL